MHTRQRLLSNMKHAEPVEEHCCQGPQSVVVSSFLSGGTIYRTDCDDALSGFDSWNPVASALDLFGHLPFGRGRGTLSGIRKPVLSSWRRAISHRIDQHLLQVGNSASGRFDSAASLQAARFLQHRTGSNPPSRNSGMAALLLVLLRDMIYTYPDLRVSLDLSTLVTKLSNFEQILFWLKMPFLKSAKLF